MSRSFSSTPFTEVACMDPPENLETQGTLLMGAFEAQFTLAHDPAGRFWQSPYIFAKKASFRTRPGSLSSLAGDAAPSKT
jgi:hypothetical protein